MSSAREFDVVVYGASGFTGRLVAEYLAKGAASDTSIRWAMAGRSLDKLAAVRAEIGAPASIPLIAADGDDKASLAAMARRTKVVITTVGPYQLYGSDLVGACAAAGTDYVDLCGEPAWMRLMIDAHEAAAKASGARIVFSCGFDSIPFDLGVQFLQSAAIARFGAPAPRVKGRVRKMKGTFSGGTAASFKATMAAAAKDPRILELLRDPFSLAPGFTGPKQPSGMKPEIDPALNAWVAPFMMAAINTRNIHRSNFLGAHPYGTDFLYDEMLVTGPGDKGEAIAKAVAADKSMSSEDGPKPGEGPSKEEREAGFYDVLFIGEMADGRSIRAVVTGDKDPGYGSTSKMIAESAISLVRDAPLTKGGIFTPAPALGAPLVKRLVSHAGLTFTVEG
ncbi:MAG: saccharopine dehydrogenase NADP-binding domain-containing protein [Alphaproteobacteria bacterium]